MIYKIFTTEEWESLQQAGSTTGAPIDLADGFIHFSTAEHVRGTAAKHFTNAEGLWLAAVDETTLSGPLKWEVSRGNAMFPHLYRKLLLSEVLWCKPLPLGSNGHEFPESLA